MRNTYILVSSRWTRRPYRDELFRLGPDVYRCRFALGPFVIASLITLS